MTQTPSSLLGRGGELLQTDRRGEAGRPGPDDDDVVLHPLAFDLRSDSRHCTSSADTTRRGRL